MLPKHRRQRRGHSPWVVVEPTVGSHALVRDPPMGPVHNIFELSQRFFAESSQVVNLAGFVGVKGGADFFHVRSVRADRFVELVAADTKLLDQ
jgi:hypothetical protein